MAGAVPDVFYPESRVRETLDQQDAGVSGDTGRNGIVGLSGNPGGAHGSSHLGPGLSSEHPLSPNSWEAIGQSIDPCRDPLLS